MKTIGVGILGAGDVADLHASAVNSLEGCKLVGLWNRTASNGEEKARKYNCKTYPTEESLFADPEIDAVFVLTNMETHCEYTIRAANAGKHVLVEKPAASNILELEQMLIAVRKAGVKCIPVHNYIYEAGIQRTKTMIANGSMGDITQFYMMYNIHHSDEIRARYPGVIRQILTHNCYTMLYLVGKPLTVSCLSHTINAKLAPQENLAMANVKMENGAMSHLSASFANDDHAGDPWTCIIKVMGTKGSTRYSYRDWVIHEPHGAHSQTYQCYPETIKNTSTYFINQIIREGKEPLSTLEDAIKCQQIIEACEQSVENGVHIDIN